MVHILTLAAKEEFGFSTRFHSLCCRSPQKLVLKQPSMHSSLFSASGKSLEQKKNRQVVQWSTEGRSIQPKLQAQSLNTVVTPIDLGRCCAKIYGCSVDWLENTGMSTQPICHLYWKKSKQHRYHFMSSGAALAVGFHKDCTLIRTKHSSETLLCLV